MKATAAAIAAVCAGLLLSFVAFGLFWIAMAWVVQGAMVLPFALVAYALGRWSGRARRTGLLMALGVMPLGGLFLQFRDAQGSHAMPVLMVALWAAGIAGGSWLAGRRRPIG